MHEVATEKRDVSTVNPVELREPDRASPSSPANVEDQHWSTPLQSVLDQPPSSLPIRLAIGGLGFTTAFAAWACLGQVNEVARAQGKLIPQGEPYKVNPVDMGKVSSLMVKEGQVVRKGEVIAKLDTEIIAQEVVRLEKRLEDSETEKRQMQELLERTQIQADARVTMAKAGMRAQQVELNQARNNISTTTAMLNQLQGDASAQMQRLDRIKPLQEQGAVAVEQVFQVESAIRDRTRSIVESQGGLQKSLSDAKRIEEEVSQNKADLERVSQEAQQGIQQVRLQITEAQAKINETKVLLASARSKLSQGLLFAPVSGTVSALKIRNIGEVVQPGQTIAEIAPTGKPLVLSAMVPSRDAGFIKPGMKVQVKLDAYAYQNYGVIPGKVVSISPDSQPNEQLGQVYKVEVQLDRNYITKDHQKVMFKAGQTAAAEIVTRNRRIIDVLVDPLKQMQGELNL